VNGSPRANIPVRPGDTITVAVKEGQHDLTFPDGNRARSVFRFEMPGSPFSSRPVAAGAIGTNRLPSGSVLATLTVRNDIPSNLSSLTFTTTPVGGQPVTATFSITR